METSPFANKTEMPDNVLLSETLGDLFKVWNDFRAYVLQVYPKATEEWNFAGPTYGWSFRIKDKKRTIIYLLPRNQYFMVALVFGEKATIEALGSTISEEIKTTIASAKVYAEGRGFRIEVKDETLVDDIKKLIQIKLSC